MCGVAGKGTRGIAAPASPAPHDLTERVRQILEEEVNPAVKAHGGRVVRGDMASRRVEIRCQWVGRAVLNRVG